MLTGQNIRLGRILKNTWQVDIIMVVTCTVVYLMHDNLIKYHIEVPVIVPTLLGTAIAFFIGFNNNQAYDRWWEARKVWGALVNDSRSWARSVINYVPAPEMEEMKKQMVYRHIAFLYALKSALRKTEDSSYPKYLTEDDIKEIGRQSNKHNAILNLQSKYLHQLREAGAIDGFRFMQMDALLVKFSDEMGMSERIKNTVFPTTYSYLTKLFIWLFVVAVSLVTAQTLGVWSIFASWLLGFVFVSTQINGMSLVNPFENTAVSIPLNQITRTIEINLLEMLNEQAIPEPVKPINNEYVL
ncbi:bestrophin family protein [Foetidibacter luteolus]|uniref:bestrophin family protein n=1 Tax=Foetidibacter luteolus TaxID=2608880 RepID=UPI00129B5E64|nr:bestrophin family ion channel [Foetidibacter luteolus]